jgi:hypothetical protein
MAVDLLSHLNSNKVTNVTRLLNGGSEPVLKSSTKRNAFMLTDWPWAL